MLFVTAETKPLNLTVIFNETDRQQNQVELYLLVGSEMEVECEAERSETRRLFWDAACRELDFRDRGRAVDCADSLCFSPTEVHF